MQFPTTITSPWSMEADTQRVSAASAGLTSLALRLAKQLAANNKSSDRGNGGNLVFSPLSIYAALALVAAGAPGAALDELLALLGARRWLRVRRAAHRVRVRRLARRRDGLEAGVQGDRRRVLQGRGARRGFPDKGASLFFHLEA